MKKDYVKQLKEVFEKMPEAMRTMMPKIPSEMEEMLIDSGISMPHMATLDIISKCKIPPMISEIGRSLSISFAMMTRIIDKLESKGLVKRIADSKDRRKTRIELTAKARKDLRKFEELREKYIVDSLNKFEEKDRIVFMKTMKTAVDILIKYKK